MKTNNLTEYGYNEKFQNWMINNSFDLDDHHIGRICFYNRQKYKIITAVGEVFAELSGELNYSIKSDGEYPTVGDWVVFRFLNDKTFALILGIIPRKNKISRKCRGRSFREQVIAANIDYAFICSSLNSDLNYRRIERYVTLIRQSDSIPVILLTKSDLLENYHSIKKDVQRQFPEIPCYCINVYNDESMQAISEYFKPGYTSVLIGSSGVGKSTLINYFYGKNIMATKDINSQTGKGKHTTTSRYLIKLDNGGVIIDTPGMRMLTLWGEEDGLDKSFNEISDLVNLCKYSDCSHTNEDGCAVIEALKNNDLDENRYKSFLKLQKELKYVNSKSDLSLHYQRVKEIKNRTRKHRRK